MSSSVCHSPAAGAGQRTWMLAATSETRSERLPPSSEIVTVGPGARAAGIAVCVSHALTSNSAHAHRVQVCRRHIILRAPDVSEKRNSPDRAGARLGEHNATLPVI